MNPSELLEEAFDLRIEADAKEQTAKAMEHWKVHLIKGSVLSRHRDYRGITQKWSIASTLPVFIEWCDYMIVPDWTPPKPKVRRALNEHSWDGMPVVWVRWNKAWASVSRIDDWGFIASANFTWETASLHADMVWSPTRSETDVKPFYTEV